MFSPLSGDIPLVGRGSLLSDISDLVHHGEAFGALVCGDTGTGKTALAHHLLEHRRSGVVPFLVTSASALSTISYGALGPFLSSASAADMASPLSVLRAVLAFFRAQAPAGRTVLVIVDDAHLLDDASSHLLAQLVTSKTITVVAFSRPVTPVSNELVSLGRDGLLERYDVGPLGQAEALELCTLILGGSVVRGASDRVCNEASGNPLFMKAILDEALANGSLDRPEGVWVLAPHELSIPVALRDLVRSVLLELDAQEQTVLELLALGGVVAFSDLVRIGSERAVSALLGRGLLRIYPEATAYAVHAHTLFGRIIRAQVPVGRSIMLRAELGAGGPTSRPLPARARIRHALWALECGEPVPDHVLLELSGLALTLLDGVAALRLADAVTAQDDLAARLLRAVALFELERVEESRSASADLLERVRGTELIGRAGVLELRLALATGGDTAAIDSTTERWAAALAAHDDGAAGNADMLRRSVQALGWNIAGRYGEAIVAARGIIADAPPDPRVEVLAQAALAEALGAAGRSAEGRIHGERALELIGHHPQTTADLHRLVFFRQVGLLIHSGDFPAAEEALRTYDPGEGRDYAFVGGSLAVLAGALDVRRGRFRSGLDSLLPALASLRAFDPDGVLAYALGTTGWAAAALGDAELSVRCSEELARVEHRGPRQFALLARAFDAAGRALLATGDADETLLLFAAEARDLGWFSCEKDILELATSLGTERSAALLADATRSLEGVEASVLHQYATALVEQDAAAMAMAGERAEVFQKYLLAADASARAMEAYAIAGDSRSQRALAPAVRRRRAMIDGSTIAEPTHAGGPTPLTAREREIALLAVEGLTNRDIARSLTVSTRTVEGHLYRIYVKLGISRREELTAEMEPLLRVT